MKKGDIVTVNDYSWAKEVVNGKLKDVRIKDCTNKKYTVIEIDCKLPLHDGQSELYRSDTIIQAISGEVILIHGTFLRPVAPTHTVMVDIKTDGCVLTGQYIEISDKLYKEIKRGSQS